MRDGAITGADFVSKGVMVHYKGGKNKFIDEKKDPHKYREIEEMFKPDFVTDSTKRSDATASRISERETDRYRVSRTTSMRWHW